MISAVLLLLLGTNAPPPVQPHARDTADPVIVDLALGRLAHRTVAAYRRGSVVYLPITELFDLAEIRVERFDSTTLRARLEPGHVALEVRPADHRIEIGDRTVALGPDDLVATATELYLATAPLGEALDLTWNVSWSDLAVTALDPSGLPIAERISRDWRRRAQGLLGRSGLTVDRRIEPSRRAWDGLVVDYSLLAPADRPLADGAYAAGLGLDILGGSFTARVQNQGPLADGNVRSDVAWFGVFQNRGWLTQLRLGDGLASGPRGRTLRGISLTNSPYLRPSLLGEAGFDGTLGPGWQVEAYRGGRAIAFDSVNALGEFSIDAPIQYGENPIEFVAYGPFGEVRRWSRNLRVDPNRIRAGKLEYGASAGQCRTERCRATANLDLRYGLSTRWTAQAGIDQFWRDSLPSLAHPYAALFGNLTNTVSVEAEAVAQAVLRGAVRYQPSPDLLISAEASQFATGVVQPILTPDGRTSQWTFSGFFRPSPERGATYLEGSVDIVHAGPTTISSGRIGASFQSGELQLMPAVRWQRTRGAGASLDQTTFEANAFLLPSPRLGPLLARTTTRAQVALTASLRLSSAAAYLSRNLGRGIRVELGGGWSRLQGPIVSAVLAADLSTIRSYTSLFRSGGRTTSSEYVQGSVLYDRPAQSIDFSSGPGLERSGITGRVFLDRNGNERFDQGEQVLPNVRVSIGMETRRSGDDGRFHLWNVTPFEPAIVAVDSTTLPSPLWVPAFGAVEVRPGPNRYQIVDIPVAPGGVIEGSVVRGPDSTAVPGVPIVLEAIATGTARRLVSFSDGQFYAIGIKPGRYRLRIPAATAQRLGLTAEPVEFVMPADVDGATVGNLVLRLR